MEVTSKCSTAELVRRIQSGDRSAEADLIERYSGAVKVIIRKSVRDAWAREDVYQDVFKTAIEKIRSGDLREPEALSGFVCSLTRNLITQSYRQAGLDTQSATEEGSAPAGQLERLLRQEQESIARRILSELGSSRDREVLYRYYLEEEDKETICADLGFKELHLNQVLCRARARYRELYNGFLERTNKSRRA